MATEGNGGLGSSEEVREGQLMDPALERAAAFLRGEDSTQNTAPWLELERNIHVLVREAFEHFVKSGPAREQIQEPDRRTWQLRFQTSMPDHFFVGKKVEGRGGALIRVKLIDATKGHVVASGPLSSLKLAVVPLEGDFENKDDDWTQEIFESHVVKQCTGKPPLLTGDLEVSLKEGEGSLGKLKFTDNSISMRSGKFRLGVKVASSLCEGIRVREGITDAFKVKDRRGESYKKHEMPRWDDYVWRLKKIGKNGPFHMRLDSKGISNHLSEEVREGQLMDPALERVADGRMEDSTKNTIPWLESYTHRLVREAFEHFVKSGPASVAAFLMEDSTQNTLSWLESYTRRLVREAFEHFVKSGPASVAAFLMEDGTQNTFSWLEPYTRRLVRKAFEHFMKSGPVMVGWSSVNRREQIQEPDRRIWQLRFQTSMPDHFFVGKKVEGRGGALIRVKLIDAITGHVVESGALSSLTLDVVVLAGDFNNEDDDDWTWEHFKSKEEPSREGKGPLLEGDLQVPLKRGVGFLEDIKFTDISTCRPSGKFRLGVKVESGFFKGIRVREAKTDAFEVKHYKKESEEKNVPRALDDDVCTLKSIGKNGPSHKNLNDVGIFKVKHFLWKLFLDPEGLRKILGKTVSNKNWKILRDHAKESVPSGKYHVYYADKTKNSGVVFKNMSELCGLIEDGEYHSTEILSASQKESENTLKKRAGDNGKDIVEYVDPLPFEMGPTKRLCSSQTDVVTWPPDFCLSDIGLASSSRVCSPVIPWLDSGAPVPCQPPSVLSGEASGNSMSDFEDSSAGSLQDVDSIDSTSLFQQDLSEKADGNTSLDALWREVDQSDSHLPGSSLDPPEQAGGNTVLSVGAHGGSFERGKQLRCSIYNPQKLAALDTLEPANRKRTRAMDILANQIPIEIGGDVDQLERWDPNPKVHCRLLDELGDRVTDIAPLRFLWEKILKASDVSVQQNRFVLPRNVVGDIIVHCLTIQQRDDLCNNGAEIQIAAFDELGRKWVLKLKKTMQSGHNFGTYVLIKDWTKMVKANGWKAGDEIKIWGLPYVEQRDQWRFGPDHDFSDITFVFTTTV